MSDKHASPPRPNSLHTSSSTSSSSTGSESGGSGSGGVLAGDRVRTPPAAPPTPPLRRASSQPCSPTQVTLTLDGVSEPHVASFSTPPLRKLRHPDRMSRPEVSSADENSPSFTYEAKSLYGEAFRTLYDFYQNRQLCDVEVTCGGRTLHCHRLVLACSSRYFRSMFTSEMAESRQAKVNIQDIDGAALEKLIVFAYTAQIRLSTDNVQSLLYASSILQVENVAQACCEFMKTHLHPTNCIGIRAFAEQHGRNELIARADQYTRDHFQEVVDCDEFASMSASHLETLLTSPDLNVCSEVEVYEAVMRWVKHDVAGRQGHLLSLMGHVKLGLLPAGYLLDTVCNEDLVRRSLQCRDLMDDAKHYQLSLAHVVPDVKLSEAIFPRKSCAGVVFCVGGRGASGDPFKTIECYDLRRDRWFYVAEMSSRRRHVGVVSIGGKVYAVGGHDGAEHLNSGEVFDPKTNKWTPIASMTTLRRGIALACLGGPIYAIGGLDDATCYNIVERYDPDSDSWSFVQAMSFPRGGVAVAALKGYLYAIGGNDGASSLDSCERYDPHLNKWTMVATMNKRRAGAGVAHLNGLLYVIGGFDDNSPLESVERYDPQANTWTMVQGMSCPRGGVGVAAMAGKIYAVGGHDGSNYLSSVEAYDPRTDTWQTISSISTCRAGAGIAVVTCHIDDLKDTSKINMSATGRKSKSGNRKSCTVRCRIIAHTSIVYTEESNSQAP